LKIGEIMNSQLKKKMAAIGARTNVCLRVVYADGSTYQSRERAPDVTIFMRNKRAEWRMLLFDYIGFLEGYFDGDIDIEGSLTKCLAAGMEGGIYETNPLITLLNWGHEFAFSNANWIKSKRNAEFHYAHNPEFYRLWLDDPLMVYTCAYWKEGTRTLEEAQRNKLDHVARKLLLKPGDEVIDIGSGFGGFLLHAQERYGVRVTGVNPTGSQVEMVRKEIERRRIGDRAQMLGDYSTINRQFDKVASIGSLEHAGRGHLSEVIQRHARYLKPGGLGVIHFIGHVGRFPTDYFIRQHVFPGGWIPSLADVILAMEANGLEVIDIENLRRHYALTLDVWAERFDRNWDRIRALDPKTFDERFRRIWRVYLYGCAERFRSPVGNLHLFQIVFSKGNTTTYPMSREFLYEQPAARAEKRSASRAA
jgi:cyclopropane-fatty-acyl-phospholipid synthase